MPNVSGKLTFNTNPASPSVGVNFPGVTISLYDGVNGLLLSVLTDSSGNYSFTNVPNGRYKVIETYNLVTTNTSPMNFGVNAIASSEPTPSDPPASVAPNQPALMKYIQSLSPNTNPITITGSNITINLVDAPVGELPVAKLDMGTLSTNLLTGCDNGTFGTLPAGTPISTKVRANLAYPSNITINDPLLNVSNINNNGNGVWYYAADRTSKDETGRMLQYDANSANAIIFTNTIPIEKNKYYYASSWIMNADPPGYINPALGVSVIDATTSTEIFNFRMLNINPYSIGVWNETGTLFYSGNTTTIAYRVYSAMGQVGGNDYYLDDLSVQEAFVNTIVTGVKSVDKAAANIGDKLNYSIVLNNIGQSTIPWMRIADTIPSGTTYVNNSLTINGTSITGNLTNGITLTNPNIPFFPSTTMTINYAVTVTTLPNPNPILNDLLASYYFAPVYGGATVPQSILTNRVQTRINFVNVTGFSKSVDKHFLTSGMTVGYTIIIPNNGNIPITQVVFTDTIQPSLTFQNNTLKVNNISTGEDPSNVQISQINPGEVVTISFICVVN